MDSKHMLCSVSPGITVPLVPMLVQYQQCMYVCMQFSSQQLPMQINYTVNHHSIVLIAHTNTGKRRAQPLSAISLSVQSRSSHSGSTDCTSRTTDIQPTSQEAAVIQTKPQAARCQSTTSSETDVSKRWSRKRRRITTYFRRGL